MKILMTGCDGQLGRTLQDVLHLHDLINTDYKHLDILDIQAVRGWIERDKPDLVINAAAYTLVDKAEEEPEKAGLVNAEGPRNLAMITGERGIPLVQISTDYVFDGLRGTAYTEADSPNPQSVYGHSKLEGELEVAKWNPKHYIVRTAWLYSKYGQNFPKTMLGLASREEVRVVDDQHGSPTYAPHLAGALAHLIETGSYGVWHLAGSGQATWYQLTALLYRLMEIKTRVVPVTTAEFPRPAQRPPFSVLKSARTPRIELPPWEEGLKAFVEEICG